MRALHHVPRLALALLLTIGLPIAQGQTQAPETILLSSSVFEHETDMPLRYTAYGENLAPDLHWRNLPEGTKQLALILDDPVFNPMQPFVHWVAYNIPVSADGLPEGLSADAIVDYPGLEGMINGANGIRRTGYFGPRPPADGKVHTYNFRIYALDYELNLPDGFNKQALLQRMEGHVLATGLLTGNYQYTGP